MTKRKSYTRQEPEVYEMAPLQDLLDKYGVNANQLVIASDYKLKNGQISNMIHRPTKNVSLMTLELIREALGLGSWDELIVKQKKGR